MPITWTGLSGPDTAVTVEIGFDTDPFVDPTTWTDVTDYVALEDAPVQIDRGRSDAQSVADAGTCTFVLNNDDKRFTPGYTGGTYGSGVKVGKQVRVSIYHNSTTYRRFTGYITSYDLSWPGGVTQQSRVAVTAVDVLGMLAQVKLRNIVEHTFLLTDPVALWPLDDGDDSEDAHEITGYRQDDLRQVRNKAGGMLKFGGRSFEFSDGDVQFGDSKGLPAIPSKDSRSVRVKSPRKFESIFGWTALGGSVDLQSATTTVATGYWVNFDQEHDEDQQVFLSSLELDDNDGTGNALVTGVDTKGRAFAAILLDDGTLGKKLNGKRIVTGGWHFIFAMYTQTGDGVVTLHVDGVLEGTSTDYGAFMPDLPANPTVTLGAARRADGTKEDNNPANARFAYFGVWTDDAADAIDPAELYEAGTTGWDGQDRTSGRVTRVLKWFAVPDGRRDVERGLSEVRVGDMKNLTALEYINECVVAEQGFFFQAGDGTCTFNARDHRWEGTAAASLAWHHPDERFTTDVEQTINRVTVTHRGGEVTRADAASRLAYGPRELSIDTQLSDRNQAKSIAEYVLKLRETMRPRLDSFTYDILTEPDVDVRDDVLGVELDEMITLTDLPTQAHNGVDNLFTDNQYSFESGTTGWAVASGCTIAQSNLYSRVGSYSLETEATAAATYSVRTPTGTSGTAVEPSTEYTAYVQTRAGTTARSTTVTITWYDAGGSATGSVVTGTSATNSSTDWTPVHATGTSPADAAFASVRVFVSAPASGEQHYLDAAGLWPGSITNPFLSFWVEGISETLSIDEWRVTFATTPHKADFTGYWVLGTSTLGTDTDLGY